MRITHADAAAMINAMRDLKTKSAACRRREAIERQTHTKTAICIGTNGDGVRYAESDAESVAALLDGLGYEVDLVYAHSDHFYTTHDLLYLAGPADHQRVGRVALGPDYVDVRKLAPHYKGMLLDTCKVGRLLKPAALAPGRVTPALAAALEYAFEAAAPEGGSIFAYWLRHWLSAHSEFDITDTNMHSYIHDGVMTHTGFQAVQFGWL